MDDYEPLPLLSPKTLVIKTVWINVVPTAGLPLTGSDNGQHPYENRTYSVSNPDLNV